MAGDGGRRNVSPVGNCTSVSVIATSRTIPTYEAGENWIQAMNMTDISGWLGCVGATCIAIYVVLSTERKLNRISSDLVALKLSIDGSNRDLIIAAINKVLEKLKVT